MSWTMKGITVHFVRAGAKKTLSWTWTPDGVCRKLADGVEKLSADTIEEALAELETLKVGPSITLVRIHT